MNKLKSLLLLSTKQIFGYVLAGVSAILNVPALFFAYYFIFYWEGSFTETGVSIFVWMAVALGALAFGLRFIKIQMMKHKTPFVGSIFRAIHTNRFLIGLTAVFALFTINFVPEAVMLFLLTCIGLRMAGKVTEGLSLAMFNLDWSDE